jgi:NAD(P)-dependent dehydrogenase (short-subunit alcohol dehydrogenase family)
MKNILITGANRGLGLEMVWHLLQEEEGPFIIATCRNPKEAEALIRMKENHPERLAVYEMDVTEADSISKTREAVAARTDHLDWLVNNAGVGGFNNLDETTAEELLSVYRVNVVGPFLVTRAFRELLKASGAGMVFLVSSRMGSLSYAATGGMDAISYPASKAALNMLGLQLAKHLHDDKIGVVMQTPGWVQTDMGGKEANYTPYESISRVLKVWKQCTFEDTGRFFGENGEQVDW